MSAQLHVSAAGYVVFTTQASDGRTLRICGLQAPRGPVRDHFVKEAGREILRTRRFEALQDTPRVRRGRAA